MLATGDELASAASKALGQELRFEDIPEYVKIALFIIVHTYKAWANNIRTARSEAKRVLQSQSASDNSEQQYLLEYYSLVREGKTNYISTSAFHDITNSHPQEPDDFFKVYAEEFQRKSPPKKRKTGKA